MHQNTEIAFILIGLILLYGILHSIWSFYQNKLIQKMMKTGVILEVLLEKDTETDAFAVEQLWSAFHGLYTPWYQRFVKAQPYISFEIKSEKTDKDKKKEISFNFWVPNEYKSLIRSRLQGLYRNAQINELKADYIPSLEDRDRVIETVELGLASDSAFSIKMLEDFASSDPLVSIVSALTELENKEIAIVQVLLRPESVKWRQRARRVLHRYEQSGRKPSKAPEWTNVFRGVFGTVFNIIDSFLLGLFATKSPEVKVVVPKSSVDSTHQKEMLEKVLRLPFQFRMRVLVGTPMGSEDAKERIRNIVASVKELDGSNNSFKRELVFNKQKIQRNMKNRYFSYLDTDNVLSTVEIASFCHLPNKEIVIPGFKMIQSKQMDAPADISQENIFALGNFRNQHKPIGIDEQARMRHMYIAGMTGVGKSVLLENMIINDIEQGRGVVVIDPHGELIDTIIEKVSSEREDIFILDPSDIAYPFGMNLLEITSSDPIRKELEKVLVVDAYITTMKRVFSEGSIGANTDDLFRMSCSAILDHPEGGGLLEMLLMLTSEPYRARVIPSIKDPIVKNYWESVFPALAGQGKFLVQNLNAPLNKIRRFIANGLVANIICQQKSTINIAQVMNAGGVILARFSRGDMGFENSALLGAMLIAKVQLAAMQRVSIPMEERIPTYLYVDEFQNFVGDSSGSQSFAEILSEARKYRLGLIIAHQFVDQLRLGGSTYLLSAIFNNCGTTITFRVGPPDAKYYEQFYFDPDTEKGFRATDIANADKYQIILRLMTMRGVQSLPFTASTLPPVQPSPTANPMLLKEKSRRRISVDRDSVRKSIQERMAWDSIVDQIT